MAEEEASPSEAGSGTSSFKNFWNIKDKISGKVVKSSPNATKPDEDKDQPATAESTQKQHRRAQVRKAQKEHRQRKENYVKHLEQEVVKLREMIAAVEADGEVIKEENTAIKDTLSKSNIPAMAPTTTTIPNQLSSSFLPPALPSEFELQYNWPSSNSSSSTQVSVEFDKLVDSDCLHINRADAFGDAYNQPTQVYPSINTSPANASISPETNNPLTLPAQPVPNVHVMTPSQSDIAVNFILSLEYTCSGHFHTKPPATPVDEGQPTGHELMASTLLYSHAPYSTTTSPMQVHMRCQPGPDHRPVTLHHHRLCSNHWTAPDLNLAQLYTMALSLPKADFEITPVQAWFLLAAEYDVGWLLEGGRLEALKVALGGLIRCFDFGAVVDEGWFWTAVREVLGEGNGQGMGTA